MTKATICLILVNAMWATIPLINAGRTNLDEKQWCFMTDLKHLTCTCRGNAEDIETEQTYYIIHKDSETEYRFRSDRRSYDVCGKSNLNLTFNDRQQFLNKQFKVNVLCYTFTSTHDQFTAIDVVVPQVKNWDPSFGSFDLDQKQNSSILAPCSQPGSNCTCVKGFYMYTVGLRDCCLHGAPDPKDDNSASSLTESASVLLITILSAVFLVKL